MSLDHVISVKKLAELLAELEPSDEVVPNGVRNLAVFREGDYVGYVDFNEQTIGMLGEKDV